MPQIPCPHCSSLVDDNNTYCPICGGTLPPTQSDPNISDSTQILDAPSSADTVLAQENTQLASEQTNYAPQPQSPEPRRNMTLWWILTVMLVAAAVLLTYIFTKRSVLSHLPTAEPITVVDTVAIPAQSSAVSQQLASPSVLTIAYPNSDDGFVNIRREPHSDAEVVDQIRGLELQGNAIVLRDEGSWAIVRCGNNTGYAYSKYIYRQSWYSGQGDHRLVAKTRTPIYFETEADDLPHGGQLGVVEPGTIIGDRFAATAQSHFYISDHGAYYYLATGFEGYLIPKRTVVLQPVE